MNSLRNNIDMSNALIIFIKNPELGKVKTRLAATIGNDNALSVYKQLFHHTHSIATPVFADKFVYYSTYIDVHDTWSNEHFIKKIQQGKTLGERMGNSFEDVFSKGYNNACIIGSDCPGITTEMIDQAFKQLQTFDVVIGPATDGGYYLLAMKNLHAALFNNISWSTSLVLEQTLAVCKQLNFSVTHLPTLIDVDDANDLTALENMSTFNYVEKIA